MISPRLALTTATLPDSMPDRDRVKIIMVRDFDSPNSRPERPTPATPMRMTGRRPRRLLGMRSKVS